MGLDSSLTSLYHATMWLKNFFRKIFAGIKIVLYFLFRLITLPFLLPFFICREIGNTRAFKSFVARVESIRILPLIENVGYFFYALILLPFIIYKEVSKTEGFKSFKARVKLAIISLFRSFLSWLASISWANVPLRNQATHKLCFIPNDAAFCHV